MGDLETTTGGQRAAVQTQVEAPDAPEIPPTVDRREQVGWCFYDWANSVFPTTVVLLLGPYLTTVAKAAADESGFVHLLGIPVHAGAFFPYAVAMSVLLQVVCLPLLGAVADYSHRRKQMLGLFAYLGAGLTFGLYFVQGANYPLGGALFVFANLSFGASIVFYNALLPDIAGPDRRDALSSRGWALGYLGGGLLLAMNLGLISQAGSFGLSTVDAVRLSLASAALWWALFTLIPLATIRSRRRARPLPPGQRFLTVGFTQLGDTLRRARGYPRTLLFLGAYLLYNDGIQAVVTLSTQFGQEELGLGMPSLTLAILLVQLLGVFGALLFGYLAGRIGGRRAIMLSLVIWTAAMVFAYGFLRTPAHFFLLAVVIALVLGGSQALSRSVYSQMIPRGREAEYFGVYEVSEKGTSWLGPLLYGLALQFTGSYRVAILSMVVLFVVGLGLLSRVDVRRAALEAGNEAPSRD